MSDMSNIFDSLGGEKKAAAQEFNWTAPDGSKLSAPTADGLSAVMAGYYSANKASTAPAQNPYPEPAQQAARADDKPAFKPPNVTPEAWVELMSKDPVKAYELVDQARFGMEDPVAYIKGLEAKIEAVYNYSAQNTVGAWRDMHEGEGEFQTISPHLEKILQERNAPITHETLNWALTEAKNRGLVKPTAKLEEPAKEAAKTEEPKAAPAASPLLPQKSEAPTTGPAGGFVSKLEEALNNPNITAEELESAAKSAGLFNPGSAAMLEQ